MLSPRTVTLNHSGSYKSSVEEKVLGSKSRRNRVQHWIQGVFVFVFVFLYHCLTWICLLKLSLSSRVSEKSPPRSMYLRFLFQFPPQHFIMPQRHQCNIQFNSVAQSCLTLCDPMDCSMPGFPIHPQLPEPTLTHVHWVSDAIQPPHPLLSPPAFNLSQYQGLFQWVSSSHQVTKVLEFQLQSFQWIFTTDFL